MSKDNDRMDWLADQEGPILQRSATTLWHLSWYGSEDLQLRKIEPRTSARKAIDAAIRLDKESQA